MAMQITRIFRALVWALVLPFVGYSIFAILTFWPLLGIVLLGPSRLAEMILTTGFVPTLVTALVFEFLLAKRSLASSVPLVALTGTISAQAWYTWLGIDMLSANYLTFALVIATIVSSITIPFMTQEIQARRLRLRGEPEVFS